MAWLTAPLHSDRTPPQRHDKILVAVFHILAEGTEFRELGPAHLDRLHKHRVTKGLVRRLDALGYEVILRPKLAA